MIRCKRDQFARVSANLGRTAAGPAGLDLHVAAVGPAQLLQRLHERSEVGLLVGLLGRTHEHADAPHPLALLRARRERPRNSRAAEQRNEGAPFHSTTSSARAMRVGLFIQSPALIASVLGSLVFVT